MIGKLRFRFEVTNDFPDDPYGLWGYFIVQWLSDDTTELLLRTLWDMDEIIEWCIQHLNDLKNENNPYRILPGETIAQAVERSFEEPLEVAEEEIDDLHYNYREAHCLRFALRGSAIPDIYIGINNNAGEISTIDPEREPFDKVIFKEGEWVYYFDMDDFVNHIKPLLIDTLVAWRDTTPFEHAREKANLLLEQAQETLL